MTTIKQGGHRLFENDAETAQIVSEMLLDLERNGMDAVRKYSERFDGWRPASFELTEVPQDVRVPADDARGQPRGRRGDASSRSSR